MTKILHIINTLAPSGAETLLMNFVANFHDPNYKFYIAYIYGEGELRKEYQFNGNVEIVDLTHKGKFSYFSLFKLIGLIKRESIDLVHTHLVHAGILGKLAAKLSRVKHIVSTRHYGFHHNENKFLYRIEDFLTKSASVVIAISNAVKDHLLAKKIVSEDKIVVIPNAIDLNRIQSRRVKHDNNHDRNPVIGSVGRLHPQKDFTTLLDSMKIVIQSFPKAHLEIIGDGSLRADLETYTKDLALDGNVTFRGKQPNQTVLQRMSEWDLFVMSSIWEGFGIALIEAMALEKAIVATKVEGIREVVDDGETGYLVPPRQPEALARKIIELLSNDETRREMGRRGKAKAEQQFSIATYVEQITKIYDSLLNVQKIS